MMHCFGGSVAFQGEGHRESRTRESTLRRRMERLKRRIVDRPVRSDDLGVVGLVADYVHRADKGGPSGGGS